MFRLLKPDEIEVRVADIARDGSFVNLLLYKTARTDAAILDETVGADRWQNDYKDISGVLYCGIGIEFEGKWIWKWDAGTESQVEKEKGEASDAFKRAGFKWGIGVALYSSPRIVFYADNDCKIKTNNNGKYVSYDRFEVTDISYTDTGKIASVTITNTSNGVTKEFGKPRKRITYELALKYVPTGYERPLSILWKEDIEAVKLLRKNGDAETREAIEVIQERIQQTKK